MHDAKFVDILNAWDDLLVHFAGFLLFKSSILDNMLEQLTTRTILHDQVQVVVVLNHLVQLNDVRVSHFLKDRDLTVDAVNIRLVFYFVFL